jgi:hypothetical protein
MMIRTLVLAGFLGMPLIAAAPAMAAPGEVSCSDPCTVNIVQYTVQNYRNLPQVVIHNYTGACTEGTELKCIPGQITSAPGEISNNFKTFPQTVAENFASFPSTVAGNFASFPSTVADNFASVPSTVINNYTKIPTGDSSAESTAAPASN